MKSFTRLSVILLIVAALTALTTVSYAVTIIPMVTVGDPGNHVDPLYGGLYGDVDYAYNIGKTEMTNQQYTDLLNAVARTDAHGLYHGSMSINQTGTAPNLSYSTDHADKPVKYASWADAARFANWLHNEQPDTGTQTAATTERGAYILDGAESAGELDDIFREDGWKWAIPTEDEWYKAAYYKGGSTTAGYWLYPTQSNVPPTGAAPGPTSNTANCDDFNGDVVDVGGYTGSPGPYGTFDQGGNLFEWVEDERTDFPTNRVWRDSRWSYAADPNLSSSKRDRDVPNSSSDFPGFRLVQIPEPGSITLLVIGLLGLAFVARRKRQ